MIELQIGLGQRGTLAMTPALRQAIGFLALSNAELSARLADLDTAHLAPLSAEARAECWPALVRPVPPPLRLPPPQTGGPGGFDTDRIAEGAAGLVAHVLAQLPLLVRAPADRGIAHVLLAALEPSGWLGAGIDEIAATAGCPPQRAEAVLQQLQGAEPTGLFARSLAECLMLQARERGLATPAFAALLGNLPLLAKGDLAALAGICGCSEEDVAAMARDLRRMNPKPGAAFSDGPAMLRPPDLVLRRDGDGWLLELNAETVPVLRLAPGDGQAAPEALRNARSVLQALERRHETVLTIAAEIVARQDAHLRDARLPLAALTINDLAAAANVHRSTASRVTAALVIALPRRTVPLRALMSAAAPAARRTAEPLSVQAVLQRMQAIVAAEDPAHPLSDEAIARLLLEEGAALARRTVVKYRGLAGIGPRAQRRRA